MTQRSSADTIGCAPAALRSTIDRRRCENTSPAAESVHTPAASGPRCASVSAIPRPSVSSLSRCPERRASSNPAIPHMNSDLARLQPVAEHGPFGLHVSWDGLESVHLAPAVEPGTDRGDVRGALGGLHRN